MRVRLIDRLPIVVAGDGSIKLAVSWIKFESRVSIFPVL